MKTRRFGASTLSKIHVLTISQTDDEAEHDECNIIGYEITTDYRKLENCERGMDFITVIVDGLVTGVVIYNMYDKSATEALTVLNPEELEFYGPEGTNHELDPH